jgi:hypothetical protein
MRCRNELRVFYTFISVNPETGKETILQKDVGNVMLLTGLDAMPAQANWMFAIQVGRDDTQANENQSPLIDYVDGTSDIPSGSQDSWGAEATAPFFGWYRTRKRFPIDFNNGASLSEVGIGWGINSGEIVSRARIVNEVGDEVSVNPLPNEYMDVLAEVRNYPPLVDATGQVTLDSVLYDYTVRASQVNSDVWGANIGKGMGQVSVNSTYWQAYNGPLVPIDAIPAGTAYPCDNADQFNLEYSSPVPGQPYLIGMQCACGTQGWNASGGIDVIRISTTLGNFQTEFIVNGGSGGIPKTTQETMIMVWELSWSGTAP